MVSQLKQFSFSLEKIISNYKFFLFDCDGVLWIEGKLLPTTEKLIAHLQNQNKHYSFLTNNNSSSRISLLERFHQSNLLKSLIKESQIYHSGYITAIHLKRHHSNIKKIFLIGSEELAEEFRKQDINVVVSNIFDTKYNIPKEEIDNKCIPDQDFDGVVVGYDEKINYYKIAFATRILSNPKTRLFGTNIDKNRKGHNGVLPGTYTMVNFVESGSERKAEIVTKPDPHCLDLILEQVNNNMKNEGKTLIEKKDVLMFGDNMTTDIKFANNCGIDSLLVMTGVTDKYLAEKVINIKEGNVKLEKTSEDEYKNSQKDFDIDKFGLPTYVMSDLKL